MKLIRVLMPAAIVIAFVLSCTARPEAGDPAARNEVLTSEVLQRIIAENDPDTYIVDVRTPAEYHSGTIPSAINIPYTDIGENPPTDDKSARIVVFCQSGARSSVALKTLAALGYDRVEDFGGIANWHGDIEYPE